MRDEEMPVLQAYRAYKTNKLLEEGMKTVRLNAQKSNKANIPKPGVDPEDWHPTKITADKLQGLQNKLLKPFQKTKKVKEIPKFRTVIDLNMSDFADKYVNRLLNTP